MSLDRVPCTSCTTLSFRGTRKTGSAGGSLPLHPCAHLYRRFLPLCLLLLFRWLLPLSSSSPFPRCCNGLASGVWRLVFGVTSATEEVSADASRRVAATNDFMSTQQQLVLAKPRQSAAADAAAATSSISREVRDCCLTSAGHNPCESMVFGSYP